VLALVGVCELACPLDACPRAALGKPLVGLERDRPDQIHAIGRPGRWLRSVAWSWLLLAVSRWLLSTLRDCVCLTANVLRLLRTGPAAAAWRSLGAGAANLCRRRCEAARRALRSGLIRRGLHGKVRWGCRVDLCVGLLGANW
jgi:hypothetical protein